LIKDCQMNTRFSKSFTLIITTVISICQLVFAQNKLQAPPQDKGLPYTRSAFAIATKALGNTTAIFSGSRYAFVNGYKVRLDTKDILYAEAITKNGKVFVPAAFASILAQKKFTPKPIPKGLEILKERWVYEVERNAYAIPTTVEKLTIRGALYVAANDLAKVLDKQVLQTKRGLLLISDKAINYKEDNEILDDAIVSIFDTPEKFMKPDMAMKYIPLLKAQGKWTEHTQATTEQVKQLEEADESNWEETPKSAYDFKGFNKALLGTDVPAAGVYPRLLFSPQDLPMLQQHIKENKAAQKSMVEIEVLFQKSWWDVNTNDGKLFLQLQTGNFDKNVQTNAAPGMYAVGGLSKDYKAGIHNSHINYITNCLTTMALYCLLTNNEILGKQVANAMSNYYALIDKKVEEHILTSDSEFGISSEMANNASTQWRGMHGVVPHMDLALSIDFAGKYMTVEQRKAMQLLIAKATYGRRTGAGDAPRRVWRDINHMTWHLTHHLAIAAIEGLDGFDAEAYQSGCQLTKDFLEFGIDKYGQIFESNGKSGGGIQFQILAMIMQARRGDNLFGHPHLRKMLTAQVFTTSPNRKETVSSGTWGGSPFVLQTTTELKAFFPEDRAADYLIQNHLPDLDLAKLNLEEYRKQLEKKTGNLRLPGPSYPGFGIGFPYVVDWKRTTKEDLHIPTDWNDDVHGVLSTASDNTDKATWLALHVRANHYMGSGHHHADVGMFYFSGLGVNWFTEGPDPKTYAGKYHNQVLIDGKAEAETPTAKGLYLGANILDGGSFGTVDQTYSYTYQWCTQVMNWGEGFSKIDSLVAKKGWELEPDAEIMKYYQGTFHYKMRPWWATYNMSNFMPTVRALWNPMQYVYRSTGLIKGNHPYALIVDDAKKDEQVHLYQWTAMLAKGVWKANYNNLPKGATVLAYNKDLEKEWAKPKTTQPIEPKKGDALLLVYNLSPDASNLSAIAETVHEVAADTTGLHATNFSNWIKDGFNRVSIANKAMQANYRVLLLPFNFGEALPAITYQNNTATISWADGQTDTITFSTQQNRTITTVYRNGETIAKSK
jgi:hypothetical protein